MKQFSVKHPVLFGIILIVAAFAAAALITAVLASAGLPSETATTLSRILVGVILLFVFRETFPRGRAGRGLLWGLPALIFVLWNIVYHLSAGASFAGSGVLGSAFVAALAPAIFEEVLFRGILKTVLILVIAVAVLFVVYFWNLDQKLLGWAYKQVNLIFDQKKVDQVF